VTAIYHITTLRFCQIESSQMALERRVGTKTRRREIEDLLASDVLSPLEPVLIFLDKARVTA
jgi:hypothetical protein